MAAMVSSVFSELMSESFEEAEADAEAPPAEDWDASVQPDRASAEASEIAARVRVVLRRFMGMLLMRAPVT
jgi:hypothetical protein